MEQDLNLISLDALPPPRTFSDRLLLINLKGYYSQGASFPETRTLCCIGFSCVGYSLFIIHLSVFLLPSDDM
ncbi:hypothetical protein NL676_034250 [Syzygium grande]|nr:hypothetical protein NL676_034250 [Syzygium grande]